MRRMAFAVLAAAVLAGCGEVSALREYRVPIHVYVVDSACAHVEVNIVLPVEMSKKYDTNPDIRPSLKVPLVP